MRENKKGRENWRKKYIIMAGLPITREQNRQKRENETGLRLNNYNGIMKNINRERKNELKKGKIKEKEMEKWVSHEKHEQISERKRRKKKGKKEKENRG